MDLCQWFPLRRVDLKRISLFFMVFLTRKIWSSTFETSRSRIAIDYGPRLIGIAISNPFGKVEPHSVITNSGDLHAVSLQIVSIAKSKGASSVILGIPVDSNGKLSYDVQNFNGQLCLKFSKALCATLKHLYPRAEVYLIDERYSTREAKARMKHEKIRAPLDAVAAACLLERFVEDEGEGTILAIPCEYPLPEEFACLDYGEVKQHVRDLYHDPLTPLQQQQQRIQMLKEGYRHPGTSRRRNR